jgi:hypothetical protein
MLPVQVPSRRNLPRMNDPSDRLQFTPQSKPHNHLN